MYKDTHQDTQEVAIEREGDTHIQKHKVVWWGILEIENEMVQSVCARVCVCVCACACVCVCVCVCV